jgi:hypothetical protein
VRQMVQAALPGANVIKPTGGRDEWIWNINMASNHRALADAHYNLKAYLEAENAIRVAILHQQRLPERTLERQREAAQQQVLLCMILARLERHPEAQQALAPALKFHRELQARGHDDLTQRIELAQALYASALAGGGKESASLTEAAALIDGLPPAMRHLKSTSLIRNDIAEEQSIRRK